MNPQSCLGPHFPRPVNDDSARSAGCFCWLVCSLPEIFSLQLAWGEARKSSRNLAPQSLSFCSPGSFVHNRYCLCELKLSVLRWEEGVTEGVSRSRRGFCCVACFTFNYIFPTLESLEQTRLPLCGLIVYSSLPALHPSHTSFPSLVILTRKEGRKEGRGSSGNIWLGINYWHSCFFFFFFFQILGVSQRAEPLPDRSDIHSWGRSSLATCWDTSGRKRAGWLEWWKGGSHCDEWLWTFIDFICFVIVERGVRVLFAPLECFWRR